MTDVVNPLKGSVGVGVGVGVGESWKVDLEVDLVDKISVS
jgi:hypothetical protein